MNLAGVLKNFGLTEKEAAICLAVLELGSASVPTISKKTKLPRSTCYDVLESLKEKGLVSMFSKKRVKYFTAEDPRKVLIRSKESIKYFEDALPQFNALYGSLKNKPGVRFYEGAGGMKIVLEEILDEAEEIMGFNSVDDLFLTIGDYWPKFLKKRIERKIPVRTILRSSEKAEERKTSGLSELRQVRIMPSQYSHHGLVMIWKNKAALFSFKNDLIALVIESEEVGLIFKAMFNFMWDSLPE